VGKYIILAYRQIDDTQNNLAFLKENYQIQDSDQKLDSPADKKRQEKHQHLLP
jgi:hypothetical protein